MAVNLILNGIEKRFEFKEHAAAGFLLRSTDPQDPEITVTTPLDLDRRHEDKNFLVHLLMKVNVPENDIFQVLDADRQSKRIGWCIPVAALGSVDHDYADNQHFLAYAYKALEGVLKIPDLAEYSRAAEARSDGSVSITDLLPEDMCLLVISAETLDPTEVFKLEKVLPSLAVHGYVEATPGRPSDRWEGCLPVEDAIRVRFMSPDLPHHDMVASLLGRALNQEDPLLRFFYFYQIVELLMEAVFVDEQADVINELISVKGDISKAKQALERLGNLASEKKRLVLLIDSYSQVAGDLEQLRLVCNDLLRALDLKEGDNFNEYFYAVRNTIFHNSRGKILQRESMLKTVIDEFVKVLPLILSRYKVAP